MSLKNTKNPYRGSRYYYHHCNRTVRFGEYKKKKIIQLKRENDRHPYTWFRSSSRRRSDFMKASE